MNNSNTRITIIIAVLIIIVIGLVILISATSPKTQTISYSELIDGLQKDVNNENRIIGVYFVGNYEVNVLYKKDNKNLDAFKTGKYKSATAIVIYRDNLAITIDELFQDTEAADRPYVGLNNPNSGSFMNYLFPGLILLFLVGFIIMFFYMMKGGKGAGAMSFGKNKSRLATNVKIRFNDVAGADEEKEELKEVVEFLKAPRKYRSVGARIPKGVLLVGNPGTGKTLFARAVAGEANVPFFQISGSDFVEMFVGVGAARVRDLFTQAKRSQPCIVFIDEIDAVGRKRGAGLGGGNDEREQTLNQLLVQMDGFDPSDGIVVMAATNRSDVLDPALLRPGRFDRHVYVNMPDIVGREGIFKVHSRNKPLGPDVDFKQLARVTTGFSGADIENLLNEAAILAARDNRNVIFMQDIKEGISKVLLGPQKRSRVISEKDKRITAYHEAGHAIVALKMKNAHPVNEVSIVPRGVAGGYTMFKESDDTHITKNALNDKIAVLLGGRAAEEIIIQDISSGASMDLKESTSLARHMVADWGMSDSLPNIYFGVEQEVFIGRDYQSQSVCSENTAKIIDQEMRKIIDTNYERAIEVLKTNIVGLHNTVKLLFEHETIYGDELKMIVDEHKSVEQVTKFINDKRAEQAKIAAEHKKAAEQAEQARAKAAIDAMNNLTQAQKESTFAGQHQNIIVPEPTKSYNRTKITDKPSGFVVPKDRVTPQDDFKTGSSANTNKSTEVNPFKDNSKPQDADVIKTAYKPIGTQAKPEDTPAETDENNDKLDS
ncbi:MAG: ATP-dependent zinc metalloprotease FtsH [Christensenellaceae bacterium]|jgi:cell division protease FtsH|nr:ATP-dependent zinc metalloprotease FtsH [Christensenellaceae bacterium]